MSTQELTYAPYKEPLRECSNGYGYMGVMAQTKDGEFVQCHICGNLVGHLGSHANKTHGINAHQYREKFGLARRTPLLAPEMRERYVLASIATPPSVKQQRIENLQNLKDKGLVTHPSWSKSLETRNREGSCPDQLIDKIKELAAILGKQPTLEEFREHYHGFSKAVYDTFGSWNKALKIAGYSSDARGRHGEYSREILIDVLQNFAKAHNRRPVTSDLSKTLPTQWTFTRHFGGFTAALKEAGLV